MEANARLPKSVQLQFKNTLTQAANDQAERFAEGQGQLQELEHRLADLRGEVTTTEQNIVDDARQRADSFLADGRAAVSRNDAAGARQAIGALEALRDTLRQEYVLRLVTRPREQTGVWRIPGRSPGARNYYLIVEAVAPDGHLISVPVTSEEDGRTQEATKWGVRVSEDVFDQVRRDMNDDGIVQRNILGEKRRGRFAVDYLMPVMGGAILAW